MQLNRNGRKICIIDHVSSHRKKHKHSHQSPWFKESEVKKETRVQLIVRTVEKGAV